MQNNHVFKITLTAMFAALSCVATMVIQLPTPMGGYIHLGDCLVLLSGFWLGPVYGMFAAGIGSMFADILSGYAHYALATLLIKGACAFIAGSVYFKLKKSTLSAIIGGVLAEAVMVFGYFTFDGLFLGSGLAAATGIPANMLQGSFGILAGVMLLKVIEKNVLKHMPRISI